jgi:nucleotide-binding universal stress UspA family protein
MKRFKNILYAVDTECACREAFERAVRLAENNQAKLTAVAVVPPVTAGVGMRAGGPISVDLQAALLDEQLQALRSLVEPFRDRVSIHTKVLAGTPFLELIYEVLRSGHDLVIRPPEDPGWLGRLFGSDDMHLLRKCPCPVWLVKCRAEKPYRRILAAVDAGDSYSPAELESRRALNRQVLELASSIALAEFAELHIAHAWEAIGESVMRGGLMNTPENQIVAYVESARQRHAEGMAALLREMESTLGDETIGYLKPKTHLVKGWARKEIPALARQLGADLVVMGTVARTGVAGFIMGNTAEAILGQIECSVLAIKPAGFVTPVTLPG